MDHSITFNKFLRAAPSFNQLNRVRFLIAVVAIAIAPDTHRAQADSDRCAFRPNDFRHPRKTLVPNRVQTNVTVVWLQTIAPVEQGLTIWAIPSLTSLVTAQAQRSISRDGFAPVGFHDSLYLAKLLSKTSGELKGPVLT
jgi:hypothetical protein